MRADSGASQYIPSSAAKPPEQALNPVVTSRMSDVDYINQSIGREGLKVFEEAKRQYERTLLRGDDRRSSEMPKTSMLNVHLDKYQHFDEVGGKNYENFLLSLFILCSSRFSSLLFSFLLSSCCNVTGMQAFDHGTAINSYLDGGSTVVYEDDEDIGILYSEYRYFLQLLYSC